MQAQPCVVSVVISESPKIESFFSSQYGGWDTFTKGSLYSTFKQKGTVQRAFLISLFLNHLQLKIILIPKWHIWERHTLIPIRTYCASIISFNPRNQNVGRTLHLPHFRAEENLSIQFYLAQSHKRLISTLTQITDIKDSISPNN